MSALGLTLVPFIEGVLSTNMPELGDDPTATIMAFLKELSFEEAAMLIQALNKTVAGKRSRRPVARHRSRARSTRLAPSDRRGVGIGDNGRGSWRGNPR